MGGGGKAGAESGQSASDKPGAASTTSCASTHPFMHKHVQTRTTHTHTHTHPHPHPHTHTHTHTCIWAAKQLFTPPFHPRPATYEVAGQHALQQRRGPALQGLGEDGVVRVGESAAANVPRVVPAKVLHVNEETHELRDGEGRMRVVQLDRSLGGWWKWWEVGRRGEGGRRGGRRRGERGGGRGEV